MNNNSKKRTKVASSKKTKATKVITAKPKLFSWKDFIPMIGVLIAFVVLIVGLFTQMVKIEQNTIRAFDPITYFIKVVPQEFASMTSSEEIGIQIVRIIFAATPWLLAVIPTLILFGFNIYKTIRYVCYHDLVEFDYKKLTRWMFAFVLPYIMFVGLTSNGALWYNEGKNVLLYSVGYGPLIAFSGLVVLFISKVYATKEEANLNKVDYIFKNIPYLVLIAMALTSSYVLFKGTTNFIDAGIKYRTFSAYTFVYIFGSMNELHLDMFFSIICFLLAPIFIPFIARAKNNSTKIIFSSILSALALGTLSCAILVAKNIKTTDGSDAFSVGYSVYCLAIFSIILLVTSIISAVLKKKKVIE